MRRYNGAMHRLRRERLRWIEILGLFVALIVRVIMRSTESPFVDPLFADHHFLASSCKQMGVIPEVCKRKGDCVYPKAPGKSRILFGLPAYRIANKDEGSSRGVWSQLLPGCACLTDCPYLRLREP